MEAKLTLPGKLAAQQWGAQGRSLICWLALLGLALAATAAYGQTFTTLKSFGNLTNVTGLNPRSQLVEATDGTLYGTTFGGDGNIRGTVFRLQPDGSGFTVLKWFTNSMEGVGPQAGLTLSGSTLYGTTSGSYAMSYPLSYGTVFKINTDGTDFTVLKDFSGNDGEYPQAELTLSGGTLYGTTYQGGSSGSGTVFKINTDGTGFTVLKNFSGANGDGAYPDAGLTLSGSTLYGTTYQGGSSGYGTVFQVKTDGTGYTVLRNFAGHPSDGGYPHGSLTRLGSTLYGTTSSTVFKVNTDGTGYTVLKDFNSDGGPLSGLTLSGSVLYGTTFSGGSSNSGTVFQVNTDGTGYMVLRNFTGANGDGAKPWAGLMLSGSTLYGTTFFGGSSGFGTVFKVNADGTGFTIIRSFTLSDGARPRAALALSGSTLYGTTRYGGSSNFGMVFRVNTDGTGYTVLKNFASYPGDGAYPQAGLTLSDGTLFGTTESGGSSSAGTVFRVNTDGTGFAVLKNFDFNNNDGVNPRQGLTQSGSTLYGTTDQGGLFGAGTVFKVNTNGTGYTVVKQFTSGQFTPGDGAFHAGLTLSGITLYGTTLLGGSSGHGTVFKVNTDGTGYTALKNFDLNNSDGAYPYAGLTLSGSTLYGTAYEGGSWGYGTLFKLNTDGTDFTVLRNFAGYPSDGASPRASLTLSGNTLYGTTESGGRGDSGTVFQVNTDGTGYLVLRNFAADYGDGAFPYAGLMLSGSVLYGTTESGGSFGLGTVFKIDLSNLLTLQPLGNAIVLNWINPAWTLQAAPSVSGIFTNIPGATSPYTNAITDGQKFFRLLGN